MRQQYIDPAKSMGSPNGNGLDYQTGQAETAVYDPLLKQIRSQTKAEQAMAAAGPNVAARPAALPSSINAGPDAGLRSLQRAAIAKREDMAKDEEAEMAKQSAFGGLSRFRRPRRQGAFRQ